MELVNKKEWSSSLLNHIGWHLILQTVDISANQELDVNSELGLDNHVVKNRTSVAYDGCCFFSYTKNYKLNKYDLPAFR